MLRKGLRSEQDQMTLSDEGIELSNEFSKLLSDFFEKHGGKYNSIDLYFILTRDLSYALCREYCDVAETMAEEGTLVTANYNATA